MPSVTRTRYFYPNISGLPLPLGSQEVITQRVSPAIFKIMGPTYWCHELDLTRSHDVIGHVTNRSAICHFLLVSQLNRISFFNRFRDICIQIYLGHATLTFLRHVTLDA